MRTPPLVGVEHEFEIFDDQGTRLDMRSLIGGIHIGSARADPADPLAVRCPTGGVVTADGAEAEIATPPLRCGPALLDEVLDHVAALETTLDRGLGPSVRRDGYSTHISIEVPDRRVAAVARTLSRRWSAALMLMTQHPTSPGLLLRPRWNRMEFGCEHLEPSQLTQAIAFCLGATTAVQARSKPLPVIQVQVRASRQRFGWFVDRAAFGQDLLVHGRATVLRQRFGRAVTAQASLEQAWMVARTHVVRLLDEAAAAQIDDVIEGHKPLPAEVGRTGEDTTPRRPIEPLPYDYRSGDLVVAPHLLTWRLAVFSITTDSSTRWLEVPGTDVRSFLQALHRGSLDTTLRLTRDRVRLR